jgi:hypothetical protein
VNGSPALIERNEDGTIGVAAPAGRTQVRLYFQEPASLAATKYASLITWLGLIVGLAIFGWRSRGSLRLASLY